MIKLYSIFCLFLCLFLNMILFAQSQATYHKHSVKKGETVRDIAQKYNVTPFDIYRINPDSKKEIKEKMVLLIPSSKSINTSGSKNTVQHEVLAQETLFGISQKYQVSLASLQELNKDLLSDGLQPGQILLVPKSNQKLELIKSNKQNDTLFHIIKPQETAFSLSKQYGLSIQKLEEWNPVLKNGFQAGEKVIVRIEPQNTISNLETIPFDKIQKVEHQDKLYQIKPKETLFGLSKSFKVSQEALVEWNPELKNGVHEGMRIKIPTHAVFTSSQNQISNLAKTLQKREVLKDLVVLLPFNMDKMEVDSLNINQNQHRKDPFLNMTLDLYSGVLMAIDSAKNLGIQMKVHIFDSKENKSTSDVFNVYKNHDWQNTAAVIGPLYPHAVEQLAQLLNSKKIPVISPLREISKSYSNLYQSMPTSDHARQTIFQFLVAKKESIIAAVDANRGSTKQFLTQKGGISFIENDEKGQVSPTSLNSLLKKNVTNYVILDSKRTVYILGLINALIEKTDEYDIKLVSLEKNDAFDFDEISIKKLAKLHLTYPSITNDFESAQTYEFYHAYRKKFNAFPSQFAIRGFDVTLDVILRMAQKDGFIETSKDRASEQIANKFDYILYENGYVNQGIYILEYQEDLTIKLAE